MVVFDRRSVRGKVLIEVFRLGGCGRAGFSKKEGLLDHFPRNEHFFFVFCLDGYHDSGDGKSNRAGDWVLYGEIYYGWWHMEGELLKVGNHI